jgi:hypothetical protein
LIHRRHALERVRRRNDLGDPLCVDWSSADLEVRVEWAGDLVGDELLERLAGDPTQDLADQVTMG